MELCETELAVLTNLLTKVRINKLGELWAIRSAQACLAYSMAVRNFEGPLVARFPLSLFFSISTGSTPEA